MARKLLKDDQNISSLHTLEQYRDEVHETVTALNGMGVDAERKPAGFKELQISLRDHPAHRRPDFDPGSRQAAVLSHRAQRFVHGSKRAHRRALPAQAGPQRAEIRSVRWAMRFITLPASLLVVSFLSAASPRPDQRSAAKERVPV